MRKEEIGIKLLAAHVEDSNFYTSVRRVGVQLVRKCINTGGKGKMEINSKCRSVDC